MSFSVIHPDVIISMRWSDFIRQSAAQFSAHTVVSRVGGHSERALESAAALESLCRAYWFPLYAYVRHCGQSHHDAQDRSRRNYFRRLLEKR